MSTPPWGGGKWGFPAKTDSLARPGFNAAAPPLPSLPFPLYITPPGHVNTHPSSRCKYRTRCNYFVEIQTSPDPSVPWPLLRSAPAWQVGREAGGTPIWNIPRDRVPRVCLRDRAGLWARGAGAGRSQQRLLRAWAVLGRQGCRGGVCFGVRAAVRSSELMLWPPRCRLLLEHTCAWGLERRLWVTHCLCREGTCPRGWGWARGSPSVPKEEIFGSTVTRNGAEGFQILLHGLMGFEIPGTQCSPFKHPA